MSETTAQFMERQRRRVARFGRDAEAAAHDAYGKAIRAGQDLKLSSSSDVMRHGAQLLQGAERQTAAIGSKAKQTANKAINHIGAAPGLRSLAIDAARTTGNAAGVVRGGVHAAEGLADGVTFVARLVNPLDEYFSPPGQAARDQVASMARVVSNYAKEALADPQIVVDDVKAKAHQIRIDLDPRATPTAPTFGRELHRNFAIGENQGELAFDIGALAVGGPGAKFVKGLSRAENVGNVGKYLEQGFSPRAAAHLAEPYPARKNRGSHFIPMRTRLPTMFGTPLPREYMDGPFNKQVPPGISRGDFYEHHYAVDPRFGGAGLLDEGWSGKNLGLPRYGLPGRVWHGSPAPLKARVGGFGAAAGGALYNLEGGVE